MASCDIYHEGVMEFKSEEDDNSFTRLPPHLLSICKTLKPIIYMEADEKTRRGTFWEWTVGQEVEWRVALQVIGRKTEG